MVTYKCLVNGNLPEPVRARVRAGLARIHREFIGAGSASVAVEFTEIDPGLWFTAGEPSRASMVLGSVPAGTPQSTRIALMEAVCRMFSDLTGASYDDVMVVAADRSATTA